MTQPLSQIPASRLSLDPQLLGDGGQGWIYRVTAIGSRPPARPLAYKRYKPHWQNQINAEALKDLVSLRHRLAHTSRQWLIERTAWPETVVVARGQPVGFLMSLLPNNFVQPLHVKVNGHDVHVRVEHLLNSDAYIRRMGIQISDGWRLGFLHDVAETIDLLHRNGVTVGDISPLNIYPSFSSAPRCFFVDCDAMQLNGCSVLPQAQTRGWEVPGHEKTATPHSDAYKLALLAVRLFAGDQDTRDPTALARCSWQLGELARDGLNIDPMSRPPPAQWVHVLRAMARASLAPTVGRTTVGATPGHRVRQPPSGAAPRQAGSPGQPFTRPRTRPRAQPRTPPRRQPRGHRRARSRRSRLLRHGLIVLLSLSVCGAAGQLASTMVFDSPSAGYSAGDPNAGEPLVWAAVETDRDVKTLRNEKKNSCLQEISSGISIVKCNNSKNQRWSMQKWDDGTLTLVNVGSGHCLEESTQNVLRATGCGNSHSPQQSWFSDRAVSGTHFKNQGTQHCIEAVGEHGLRPNVCRGRSTEQGWRIKEPE
jgi:hypothetical protein